MRTFLRWTGRVFAGLLVLLLIAAGVVYALSLRVLRAPEGVAGLEIPIIDDSASVAEGERLATIRGCKGCHGQQLEGRVMVDHPALGRLVAPSLPDLARRASPADMERAIRGGTGLDGRSLLVMPSDMYFDLSDDDLARILAWTRSLPEPTAVLPKRSLRLARLFLVTGRFRPAHVNLPPERVRLPAPGPNDTLRLGEYIAKTSCPECHGMDLLGEPDFTPSLALVAGYSAEEFGRFIRTGVAKGGRELEMMSDLARGRLSRLRDEEITALRLYLSSLAGPAK